MKGIRIHQLDTIVRVDSGSYIPISSGSNNTYKTTVSELIASQSGTLNAATLNGQPQSYYTNASNISSGTLASVRLPDSVTTKVIGITIDGGGSVPSTGVKGYVIVPYSGTIIGWNIVGDTVGSGVVDVYKTAYGSSLPSGSIAASAKPTLSNASINKDDTVTGWTTAIVPNDIIGFNLDSVSTITRLTVELKVRI